jgi:small subunit ribosomal protein S1
MQPMFSEETHNAPTTQTPESATEQPENTHVETPTQQPIAEQQPELVTDSAQAADASPNIPRPEKEPSMEDFATALETFEQEQAQTEAALNEEQIVTGTVLKVTPQYVVVDIGYKSEGVIPVAEFQDHEGNVTVGRGDEIAVMREPGST